MTIRDQLIADAQPEHREAVARALDGVDLDGLQREMTPALRALYERMRRVSRQVSAVQVRMERAEVVA